MFTGTKPTKATRLGCPHTPRRVSNAANHRGPQSIAVPWWSIIKGYLYRASVQKLLTQQGMKVLSKRTPSQSRWTCSADFQPVPCMALHFASRQRRRLTCSSYEIRWWIARASLRADTAPPRLCGSGPS